MEENKQTKTCFLNVDLDIKAGSGLSQLLRAMGSSVTVLNHQPRKFLSVELRQVQPRSIDEAIKVFFDIINNILINNILINI